MIYLIKSPSFKYKFILKIGYTSDDVCLKRFDTYSAHNPESEVLYKIPGGTQEDETNLHRYFRHLRYCRSEWYIDSQDIINFFKTHTTKESLKEIDIFEHKKESLFERIKTLRPFVISVEKITGIIDNSIYDMSYNATENVGLEWICNYYPDMAASIIQDYEDTKEFLQKNSNLKIFIDYLRDPTNGHISDRLRELCETKKFTPEEKSLIAHQISEKFDQYYNLVGPKRCAQLGYYITDIKKEVSNLSIGEDKIINLFYSKFKVGDRISNVKAKEMVREIYNSLGLEKTPKATDIGNYFEINKQLITDPDTGTRVNGIVIKSKK